MFRCGNLMLLTNIFFYVAKSIILTPLSLQCWCRLSFRIVGLKICSLPSFVWNSQNRSFVLYLGEWSKTCCNSSPKLSFKSSHFSSLVTCTFRTMILHQRLLRTVYDILPLTNSTLLLILLCSVQKILFPIYDFRFLFHRKNYIPLLLQHPHNFLHTHKI